ncbi:glycosyltransferase [Mucilaginibacter gynuensis]|uniref:Glycosyltransferase n=1 Tax=Mucilaginibacter gynuensis TaxID=1302236 RepID=A0ABP8GGZ4_9SPHI
MKNQFKGKRILIANVPTDGHFNPLTGLARYLHETGYDVRWYTSKIFSDKLRRLGILHYPFVTAKELNGENLVTELPELLTAPGHQKGKIYLKNLFIDRATEYFADIREIYNTFPFDLFIADSMFSGMPFVRYKLNVPVMAIGIVPLIEDSVDTAPAGRALPPANNKETHVAYAEMYRQKYTGIKELINLYKADLHRYNITVTGSFIFDTLVKEATIYLQIGVPGFEYTRSDIGKNINYIGALLPYAAPRQQHKWYDPRLKESDKIVLVTQGTIEGDVSKILEPTLFAFAGTDVLIVATTGGNGTEQLREKYKHENIIIEDYIPFDDIMPYVAVFITNGGYGGTILSIKNGVPIVAAGIHELKNEICARIDYFGLGIDLKTEKPSSDAIFAAVERIMIDKNYKERVISLRDEMNQYDSLALCSMYVENLLPPDSSMM